MIQNTVGKIAVALIATTALNAANAIKCPSQTVIKDAHIVELGATGETKIGNETFKLIAPDPSVKYSQPVLPTKELLSDYLDVTEFAKAPYRSGTKKEDLRKTSVISFQSPEKEKDLCEYTITVGTSNDMGIIAISKEDAEVSSESKDSSPAPLPPTTAAQSAAPQSLPPRRSPPPVPPRGDRAKAALPKIDINVGE